jgi:hypothetical protein
MGIPSWIIEEKITVKKNKLSDLHDDILEFFSNEDIQKSSIDSLIEKFGYKFQYNENGDAVSIAQVGEKTYYEDDFVNLLAAHIESGSFLHFGVSGEAGDGNDYITKWLFKDGKVFNDDKSSNNVDLNINLTRPAISMLNSCLNSDWTAIYSKDIYEINVDSLIAKMFEKNWHIVILTDRYKPYKNLNINFVKIAGLNSKQYDSDNIKELLEENNVKDLIFNDTAGGVTFSVGKNFDYPSWIYCEQEIEWKDEKATLPVDIAEFLENSKVQYEIHSSKRVNSLKLHNSIREALFEMIHECILTTDGEKHIKNY